MLRLKFGLLRHVRLGGIEAVRVDDGDENRHEGDGPEDDRAGDGGFVFGKTLHRVFEEGRRLRLHLHVGKTGIVLNKLEIGFRERNRVFHVLRIAIGVILGSHTISSPPCGYADR